MDNILKKISTSLITGNDQLKTNFCAEYALNPADINVAIDGIGTLEFPLTTQKIEQLLSASSKAKFGLRNQTILDENVRSTQEIPIDKLHVSFNKNKFSNLLQKTRQTLGLGEHVEFIPHLHSMLIYNQGQFFKKHQDTEKMDGMVATLIVVLPSAHIGGDLIVEHNDKSYTFSSENIQDNTLKCFAFYADCHHEVKKITQGYRVALTYNLIVSSQKASEIPQPNHELTSHIKEYFSGDDLNRQGDPRKLVYFFDHNYSEHGLRWDLLKGTDYRNALSLSAAAKELGLTTHLALVEIHESWETYDDDDEENPELGDLLDGDTNLSYWIDTENKSIPFNDCSLIEEEMCWTKDTEDFKPYDSQHEGYMGNYGNTMDYWYRRAAIVLWKHDQDIAMQFKLNQENALQDLVALTELPGQKQTIINTIKKVNKYICEPLKYRNNSDTIFFSLLVRIALYIKNQEMAHILLNQFSFHLLTDDMLVPHIDNLLHIYGIDWCLTLLENWKNNTRGGYYNNKFIIDNMGSLVQQLLTIDNHDKLTEFLIHYQISAITHNDKNLEREKPGVRNRSLQKRIDTIKNTICACIAFPATTVLGDLINHLMVHPYLYSEINLAELYFSLDQQVLTQLQNPYIKILGDFLITTIGEQCQVNIPSPNDWSIKASLTCKCQYCNIVVAFLQSSNEQQKIWPLSEVFRNHIIDAMKDLELPVDLSVEKNGRPYTLIIAKNNFLHKNAQEKLEKLQDYQKKLHAINKI